LRACAGGAEHREAPPAARGCIGDLVPRISGNATTALLRGGTRTATLDAGVRQAREARCSTCHVQSERAHEQTAWSRRRGASLLGPARGRMRDVNDVRADRARQSCTSSTARNSTRRDQASASVGAESVRTAARECAAPKTGDQGDARLSDAVTRRRSPLSGRYQQQPIIPVACSSMRSTGAMRCLPCW
jgi:hypothetical protein